MLAPWDVEKGEGGVSSAMLWRRGFTVLAALLVSVGSMQACADSKGPTGSEAEAIKDVVRAFIYNAYHPAGDTTKAYELLATETRSTCTAAEFESLATFGKRIVGTRDLIVTDIRDLRLSGNIVTLRLQSRMTDRPAFFIPEQATLVKEGGSWLYKVTADPDCHDPGKFFTLGTPAQDVAPAWETDPNCERGYPFICIPLYPPDLDCEDIPHRKFVVVPPDPHGFDPDGDYFGCAD